MLASALRSGQGAGQYRTAVIGNEAADLDSLASALALSACISRASERSGAAVPFAACTRADLPLRKDAHWLLSELRVAHCLASADDAHLFSGSISDVVLVDCNSLSSLLQSLSVSTTVTQVIDHHEDEGIPHNNRNCEKIIEPVGSCSTLVAEHILSRDPSLAPHVSDLLLGAIVIDTQNLTSPDRTTDRDIHAAHALERSAGGVGVCSNTEELYQILKRLRFSQDHLSTMKLLKKDYKQWQMGSLFVGIASISVPLEDLCARESFDQDVSSFMTQNNIGVLIIMTAYEASSDGAFTREAAVCCTIAGGGNDTIERILSLLHANGFLLNNQMGKLSLSFPSNQHWAAVQLDPGSSRKKVQPSLQDGLEVR